jgi:hypothetical protein
MDADSGGWLAAEELPAEARTAAMRPRQLAADAQQGASWYQRARTNGLVAVLDFVPTRGRFAPSEGPA